MNEGHAIGLYTETIQEFQQLIMITFFLISLFFEKMSTMFYLRIIQRESNTSMLVRLGMNNILR